MHGGTLVTLFIDFFVNDIFVTKFKENLFGLGLMIFGYLPVYMLYAFLDKPVYKILTFKDTDSYVYVLVSILLQVVGFGVLMLLSTIKKKITFSF